MEPGRRELRPVSMRNATVYGISPGLRLDIVLNNLAAWAHTTGAIRLLSDGTAWRPLVHLRDVVVVARALLEAPERLVSDRPTTSDRTRRTIGSGILPTLSPISSAAKSRPPPARSRTRARTGSTSASSAGRCRASHSSGMPFPAFASSSTRIASSAWPRTNSKVRRYVRVRQLRHLLELGALDADLRWRATHDSNDAVHRD